MEFRFSLIFVIECIGIVSFAVSGTIIAIRKELDFVGAIVFALVTSFGGGLIRDAVTGVTPPLLLCSFEYLILAILCIVTSVTLFQISFHKNIAQSLIRNIHNMWIELTDTVGLAAFCVLGVDSALASCPEKSQNNVLLLVFCGCITGVGGGIIRDMMSAEIPSVFRKHIYLLPAVFGSAMYVWLLPTDRPVLSHLAAMVFIITVRYFAIRFRWNCPTPLKRTD